MKKLLLLFSGLLIVSFVSAQSIERFVIGSGGGSYNDGTTYVDYTSGETVISTIGNVNNFLTQGFQQPFTNTYVAVQELPEQSNSVQLFPNPVVDQLNIQFTDPGNETCRIMLMDGLGQLLVDIEIVPASQPIFEIDFSRYATGHYYLRIYQGKELIQTGKIIKINQ